MNLNEIVTKLTNFAKSVRLYGVDNSGVPENEQNVYIELQELLALKEDALGFTPEDSANKRTSWQVTPDDTHYPSEKLVKDSLDLKQNVPVNYYPSAIAFGNNDQQYDISGTTWVTATAGIPDVAGHLLTDVLTAIATPNDGNYFAVREATGAASETNPNTITFTFTGVTDLNVFKAVFRYVGSASHRQVIELYNKNTLAWDHLIEFSYSDNYEIISSEILNPLDYIDSGTVLARKRHLDAGINTHYDLISFIVLGSGGGAGGDSIQTAIEVPFTPNVNLVSTNVQEAIVEVEGLKANLSGAEFTGEVKFNKAVETVAKSVSFSGSLTINFSDSNIQYVPITGDTSITLNPLREGVNILILTNDATAGRAVTIDSTFGTKTDNSATHSTAANKVNIYTIIKYGSVIKYTIETSS